MKRLIKILNLLLGIALIGIIGWGIFAFFKLLWQSITALQPDLASAIIAGSATIIVAVISIVVAKFYERKKEIEIQQRAKKIEVYEQFMEKWFGKFLDFARNKHNEKDLADDDEFIQFLAEFTRKLILWGSDSVVKKYSSFRQESKKVATEPDFSQLYQFEQVLLEIRKDIGHSNQKLESGDLLSLFINDIQKPTDKTLGK